MTDIILHHYKLSPFGQKIRSMFGYTQMHWQSVITKEMPPRKKLQPLIGKYRKIPVAQIGADVFCDTRSIAKEIARLADKPDLDLFTLPSEQRDFIAKTDLKIFFATLMTASSKQLNKKALQALSLPDIGRLLLDRINMGRTARVKIAGPKKSKQMLLDHLTQLEGMLDSQAFLYGDTPTHADFSAFHSLWFFHVVAEKTLLNSYPKVLAWLNRVKDFGDGESVGITAEKALEIAKESIPRKIPAAYKKDTLIGEEVKIFPADYGMEPTSGILVGSSPDQWIIARENEQVGKVNVYFPKKGYALAVL